MIKTKIIFFSFFIFSSLYGGQIIINKDLKINKEINKLLIKRLFIGDVKIDNENFSRYLPNIDSKINKEFSEKIFNNSKFKVNDILNNKSLKNGISKVKRLENNKRIFRNLKKNKYSIAVIADEVKLPSYIKSILNF